MIGTLRTDQREVSIVGAGIAGLLAADALDRRGFEVTLYEAESRAGGLISTKETEWGIAESAAHSFVATPAVQTLCQRLGVELIEVNPNSKARYILRRGKFRRFPLNPIEAVTTLLRAYFVLPTAEPKPEELTVADWAKRHLGRAAHDYLLAPFVSGIYGTRPSEILVGAAFPSLQVPRGHSLLSYQLHRALRPSLNKPRGKMMTPRNGMGTLVRALEADLERRLGDRFIRGRRITKLIDAPNLVLALPAGGAAVLLHEVDPRLAGALVDIRYTPLVSVTIFVEKSELGKVPQGVGVLIPETEHRESLGILFNSSSFSGRVNSENQVSLTVIIGGTRQPDAIRWSDAQIETAIRRDLESLFALRKGASLHLSISRWEDAIPRYERRLTDAWERARHGWCATPGRILFGNYAGQVSLRGMIETVAAWQPDCIPCDAVGAPHDANRTN